MSLMEMMGEYVEAQANELATSPTIDSEWSDAQCDAFFDACAVTRVTRNRMLVEARRIALAAVPPDSGLYARTTETFNEAIERNGETRVQAIKLAFKLAVATERNGETRVQAIKRAFQPSVLPRQKHLRKRAIKRAYEFEVLAAQRAYELSVLTEQQ